jgi:glycyl-tRNA synthetase beta chain
MRNLLFELGTEELPPKVLLTLMEALKEETKTRLQQAGLTFTSIKAYATPRRLALIVYDLAERQPDLVVERKGPSLREAFDAQGYPTPAALGFAKSCGVPVQALERVKNAKGEWLLFRQKVPGAPVAEILPDLLHQALAALPIPKRMRWGAGEHEFVRPVHWVVLLFGEEVIPASILGVRASNCTFGHRFHCSRPLVLKSPDHYAQVLEGLGFVIADFTERRLHIQQQTLQLAKDAGGTALIEDSLLDEVTALVEWPVGLLGSFDARFLTLPKEVLITVMQSHQRYFPVIGSDDKLKPCFIAFANLDSKRPEVVRAGNERVIRPRLADAEFFWQHDLKIPLEHHLEKLKGQIFQQQLGTLFDKTQRLEQLAAILAEQLNADVAKAKRAALLSKTDLATAMVGEFPELQGIMGYYYAKAQGEDLEVAAALDEQYRPRKALGPLPETLTGQILALADKLDTLIGIFSLGLQPSGTKDPYALRRAAFGVIRIILEKRLNLDLKALLKRAAELYPHQFDREKTISAVYHFLLDRLKSYLLEQGFAPDEFEAVAALEPSNLLDFYYRIEAVHAFRKLPEAQSLTLANKRIRNILKPYEEEKSGQVLFSLLQAKEEYALFQLIAQSEEKLKNLLAERNYTAALTLLADLKQSIDDFFDQVLVMVEDDKLRQNRLNLLAKTSELFLKIADISRLR